MTATEGNKKRLWVVTELYYPEETSTGYYLTRTAEDMAQHFDVNVICGQPNYSARGTKAPSFERHKDVNIYRAAGTTLNKNVIVFKLINMITLGISTFFKALFKFKRNDIVLVVTTPPSLPFVTATAALLRGANHVPLIHDNYPEILFAVGKSSENSLLSKVMSFANRWLYKHSARLIAVGRDMKVLLERKTAGLDVPIEVIPNWAELETVEPRDRNTNTLLAELGLREKFVFLYAGNLGYPNDVETIVESAEQLLSDDKIHFIFLGAGVKRPWLEKQVAERSLSNVTLLDPKPRSEQITFLNACDVALVSLVRKMRGVSMPSRTYNILAAGKPMLSLTDDESELAFVIEDDNVGWHIEPGNAELFTKTALEIVDRKSELPEMGQRARQSALERYSQETASAKYLEVLSKC
ncbi:MAG TPA: glycosyltransferase family 4 protein [Pyrinomonadaceae bacterium]|nr:glycosyltransferase family 4 protein [Pyrinomonadaceae bacterium]